jgi:hypothetical protein
MKKLILYNDYVSQQDNIRNLFLNTTHNLFLKKGSTGIGGTTTILEDTINSRVVVSPTVGMIEGKEKSNSINNVNVFYIYGDSKHKWEDFFIACDLGTAVVNCTPDQIVSLKNRNRAYFNKLKDLTIFVDEIHQYIPDADYRTKLKDFLDILFNEWRANWILSSATDNTIGGQLLDIPPNQKYAAYEIVKHNQTAKQIELRRGHLNAKFIDEVYTDSLTRGKKLIIATNNSSLHKAIVKIPGYNVINLVGQNIGVKMRPIKDVEAVEDIDWNVVDIIMISSKFFAGFDMPIDADILIDTNPNIVSSSIGINDIIQIIGRARGSVGRIILNINLKKPDIESENIYKPIIGMESYADVLNKLSGVIKTITPDNWFDVVSEVISDWKFFTIYYSGLMKAELIRYNCNLVKFKPSQITSVMQLNSLTFADQLRRLLTIDEQQLRFDFGKIKKYLRYKIDGVFSPDLALLFYTAIMLRKRKLKIDIKDSDKPTRFYQKMNKYFAGDKDWDLLYQYLKTKLYRKRSVKSIPKHSQIDKSYLDYLEIRSLPSKKTALKATSPLELYQLSLVELSTIKINPDKYESDKLWSRCKDVFKRNNPAEFTGYKTKDQLLNLIGWANLFVMNGGREYYDFPIKRNRQYNPLTQIPGPLRGLIGIDLIEIDIKQANPTFIDKLVGSNIARSVYDNIVRLHKVTRDEAKVIYNTYLNNNESDQKDVYFFFLNIGYDKQQAMDLSQMVTLKKGAIYDLMVEKEREVIEFYCDIHLQHVNWFRFHDAILCVESDIIAHLVSLPSEFAGVEFDFKYYNDNNKKVILDKRGILVK